MREAQAFWRDKVPMSPGQFKQLAEEARTRAFAVSGIAKGDELATVMDAIGKAIDKGTTFQDFQKDCGEIFEKRGWTGAKAWRVDNIFRTNVQTAYNVGRYRQMMEVRDSRPYWQYSAVNDRRTRPTHRAMQGMVFPAGHPFWDTWYPPNGYRCRCGVVTLSQRNVDEDRITVRTEDPTGKLIEPVDPRTGNRIPARLLMPDPGFAHNPGKIAWGGVVDASDRPGTWKSLPGLKTAADYRRPALANVRPAEIADLVASSLLPAGKPDAFYKAEFLKRYGEEKVVKDVLGEPAILSLRAFLVNKTPDAPEAWKFRKAGHGESIPLMEAMLLSPFEIWLTPQRNEDGRIRLVKRYIGFWKTKDRKRIGGLGVYEVVDGVFQGVTSFTPLQKKTLQPSLTYVENQREGLMLFGKGR
jgi:SPP1 gp7 family putative phage head morphogenesis protein